MVEPQRVLIVEDEPMAARVMARMLEEYHCLIAGTLREALGLLTRVDITILDMKLPDASGYDGLTTIRMVRRVAELPVVIVTGADSICAEDAVARGADAFLRKPIERADLMRAVGNALRRRASETATDDAASIFRNSLRATTEIVSSAHEKARRTG